MENAGHQLNNSLQVFDLMEETMENDVRLLMNNNNELVLDLMGGTMQNGGHELNNNNEQVLGYMGGTMQQNNGQQLVNNNNEEAHDFVGDDTDLDFSLDIDVHALLGSEDDHNVGSNIQGGGDEDRQSESGPPPSKRKKRFAVRQVQELEEMFKVCTHPGPEMRRELGKRIGLHENQIRFWFQNKRSQQKLKVCGDEIKDMQEENIKLRAENIELKQLQVNPACLGCRNPIGARQTASEKLLLLSENARLKDELMRAKAYLNIIRGSQQQQHPSMSASASNEPVPHTNQQVTFLSHAESALKEFVMLATKGQPLWLPTIDGEVLSDQEYDLHTFPGMLGLCPRGYIVEATRDTDIIKATAVDVVNVLTDVAQWSGMFSNIVAYVRSSMVISSGNFSSRDGLIQLVDAEFWVQSPRLPTRNVKFLRFSKMMENRTWAVVDVSVNGNNGVEQESSGTSYMGHRLLPSGCLLEDMSGGFCKVTWVVHSEYQEAAVPPYFRQFFHSGQAFGARRWLKSLQRQCEYMAVLQHSNINVPARSSNSAGAAISALGKRGVLELAQRMTVSFYTAVSGPIAVPATNIVDQLCVSSGTTGAKRLEVGVRMVTWNCAEVMPGEPAITALSTTATVWLPGTPPQRVFEYLCNLQRRGEWDYFLNRQAVQQLDYFATSSIFHGNGVSVLRPTTQAVPDGNNVTNNMVILQQTSTDMSGSLVVYSLIEENTLRRIMGGANNAIFLLPSGFAILPDGHGKDHYTAASSSSSAPIGHNNGEGAILTVAFQEMLACSNIDAGTFDSAGQKICHAIKKIKNAVGANNVIPV